VQRGQRTRPRAACAGLVFVKQKTAYEIDDGGIRRHVALEEVRAEDLPDGVLRAPLGWAKARVVQARGGHGRSPLARPASTTSGTAAASAAGGTWIFPAPGLARPSGSP